MVDKESIWIGKSCKIEIFKDERRLIFTCEVIEIDNSLITFKDRDEIIYAFPKSLIKEIKKI